MSVLCARARRGRRIGSLGQALVETAVILPLLITSVSGVYSVGAYINDRHVGGSAAREGARYAAEIGADKGNARACQSGVSKNPCFVDNGIVQTVAPIMNTGKDIASVSEIDIYDPTTNADGSYSASDLQDVYKLVGGTWTLRGTAGYTLDLRVQTYGSGTFVGVRVVYTFQSPTPLYHASITTNDYCVMKLTALFT